MCVCVCVYAYCIQSLFSTVFLIVLPPPLYHLASASHRHEMIKRKELPPHVS